MNFNRLREDLQRLSGEDGVVPASEAVDMLTKVLAPLLATEGLELFAPDEGQNLGVDLVAATPKSAADFRVSVAIEYKHHGGGRPIGLEEVRGLIGHVGTTPYQRAMLIGRFGFTSEAREEARRLEPISIELLDLGGIEAWIRRLEIGQPSNATRIQLLIRSISHEFATLVAANPESLDHLEWRDLERMMARVMEGLGFETTLTPPSKDGGKDLILVCDATDGEESFIVELKHWRSGKRVGKEEASDFLQVIVAEKRAGGLFLSTSGYSADTFEGLTEVTRQRLRFGDRTKIVLLAQTYQRACQGLWSPPTELPEVLFEATV